MEHISVLEIFRLAIHVLRDGRNSWSPHPAVGNEWGEVWLGGAALLLACVIALRRWAQYFLTSRRVIVKNGYTGFEIQALPLDQIAGILIEQGPVARILNIGTVVLRTYTGDESITLRGVSEPEILRTRVDALTTHRADHRTGISSPPL